MSKMYIWIGSDYKEIEFRDEVRFDGKRIFVDGKLVSDVDDYTIKRIVHEDW